MFLYLYDLHIKDPRLYNTVKRRFYYQLSRSPLAECAWKTKSALLVDERMEKSADAFFKKWKPHIECYKVKATALTEI